MAEFGKDFFFHVRNDLHILPRAVDVYGENFFCVFIKSHNLCEFFFYINFHSASYDGVLRLKYLARFKAMAQIDRMANPL